jgi:pyruvate dehydrogenase E2 component (dihydrolipoamide acetyltransferase)
MSESVSLPALGESVTEGTVTRWLKQVGDRVEVDEPLLEVSTDKVDTEIPSPVAGVIEEILVAEDETVEVGTALVRIGDGSGGGAPEVAPAAEAPAPEGAQAQPAPVQEAPAAQPEPAQAQAAPAQAAPAQAAPAETAPAQATPVAQQAPAAAPAPAPAAEPAPTPQPESTEVPSSGAPAPGQEAPQEAPAPAEQVDQPPAAQQAPAQQPQPAAAPQASTPQASAPQAQPQAAGAEVDTSNAGYVTPLVRKLANEKGVDLSSLRGTGVGGRIRKQDVLDAAPAAAAPAEAAPAKASTKLEDSPLRGTTVPMSRLRKVVSERAVASMQGTAQLTTVVEVDVTKVAAFRDKVKGQFQQKTGQKLSFLPFFAKAAVEALRAYPIINATVDGTDIVYPDHENLSIAVDTERGLLTPVVRDASSLNIAQLAEQIADLAARTRDNKLKPDELAGGTFTLTNTGSRGALFDTPLVFLPQTAILGTGIVAKKPAVVTVDGGEAIAIRSTVYLALSYDHRIVDGADAARFLVAVKNRLEEGEFSADLGI